MIHFNKITVIGVGLIGGSFGQVCKKKRLADHVMGFGRGEANLKTAVALHAIDSYSLDLQEAVSDADLILISSPVMTMVEIIKKAVPYVKKNVIITDAGSVKNSIIQEIEKHITNDDLFFVGAHPIAGTEKSGAEASFVELFEGSKCIVTPTEHTDESALRTVKKVWEEMGAEVVTMDPGLHDRILASVSHLPHVIAYSLVNAIGHGISDCGEIKRFAAGGFKDITRIASSDPRMWRDICMANKEDVIRCIDSFQTALQQIKKAIVENDLHQLEIQFQAARKIREGL